MSLDLITPYLAPFDSYLLDPEVSELMINGNGSAYVETGGTLRRIGDWPKSEQRRLRYGITQIACICGREVDEQMPQLNARLADGSRVAALLPPCSVGGPQLTIRKFQPRYFSLDALIEIGSLTPEAAEILRGALSDRKNTLVSGGTGAGKTSLANALVNTIDSAERLGIIEETAEIQIDLENVFRFEARRGMPGIAEVSQRDLLKYALRHRPDRLFVGEVFGPEAFDLLQALNTGHGGSIATIHANSAEDSLMRLSELVLESGIDLPYRAIQARIGRLIDYVVQIVRKPGRRFVSEIIRVDRFNLDRNQYDIETVYLNT